MHRTQLYLDESHYQWALAMARREGKSIAQVFRDLIEKQISKKTAQKNRDPFFKVLGIGSGSAEPVAENYEDFLYGDRA
jgi:hypothetical protein